jgi:hypothetical protein
MTSAAETVHAAMVSVMKQEKSRIFPPRRSMVGPARAFCQGKPAGNADGLCGPPQLQVSR